MIRNSNPALWVGIVVVAIVLFAGYTVARSASQSQAASTTAQSTSSASGTDSSGQSGGGTGNSTGSSGSTNGSGNVVDLSSSAQMTASSVLASDQGITYGPENLVDNDSSTAWSEGAGGVGVGEQFQFWFPQEVTVTELRVIPGYDKVSGGVDRFWTNPRLKTFQVDFSDGTNQQFTAEDDRGEQTFTLNNPTRTSFVRVTVKDIYRERQGAHSAKDTSVSEFHVYGY